MLGFMSSTRLVSEEIARVFPRVTSVYFLPTMCEVFRSSGSCQYWSLTSCRRAHGRVRSTAPVGIAPMPWCSAAFRCLPLRSPGEGPSGLSLFSVGLSSPFTVVTEHFDNSSLCSCWEAFIRYKLCKYFLSVAFHSLRLAGAKAFPCWLSHSSQYTFYGLCFWSHVLRIFTKLRVLKVFS